MDLLSYIRLTMKKIFLFLVATLFTIASFSQDYFESLTFKQALKKAGKKNKLVFVQLQSAACIQCNEVATKGLTAPGVQEVAERYFIAVLLKPGESDWSILTSKYKMQLGSLFFDAEGQLIDKFTKTTTSGAEYILEMKSILQKKKDIDLANAYEERYKQGENDIAFLREFIKIKTAIGKRCDTLNEEYLKRLPKDSINAKENILLIVKTAPLLGSYADSTIRKDWSLFSEAWNLIPLSERIRINRSIIFQSRLKAIKEKDFNYACRVSNFAFGTYENNFIAAQKAKDKQMLYYYVGVNDTSNVYVLSSLYAEKYLMSVTKDSLEKTEIKSKKNVFNYPGNIKPDSFIINRKISFSEKIVSPAIVSLSNELREIAIFVCESSNDPIKFEKSLIWINRAIQLIPSPNLLEDKAKVLLKAGRKDEAIKVLEEAFSLHKSNGLSGEWIQNEINAIKKGNPLSFDQY